MVAVRPSWSAVLPCVLKGSVHASDRIGSSPSVSRSPDKRNPVGNARCSHVCLAWLQHR